MQEYKDGSFGKIKPLSELFKTLENEDELEKTKSIHFAPD